MNTRAEMNEERCARMKTNDYISKLSINDNEKKELHRIIEWYLRAKIGVKEKEFKIELATVLKSVNRFIE